jgi:hypothetical protein
MHRTESVDLNFFNWIQKIMCPAQPSQRPTRPRVMYRIFLQAALKITILVEKRNILAHVP